MINSSILQNSSVFPPLLCFGMWRNSVISGPSWTFDSDVGSTPLHRTVTLALSQPETLTLRSHRGAPVRSIPAISQKCGKLDVWNKGPLCCNVSLMRPSFLQSLSMATSRKKKLTSGRICQVMLSGMALHCLQCVYLKWHDTVWKHESQKIVCSLVWGGTSVGLSVKSAYLLTVFQNQQVHFVLHRIS